MSAAIVRDPLAPPARIALARVERERQQRRAAIRREKDRKREQVAR